MFYSLPAETVFEAKERTKRATAYFFVLLVLLYVFFVDLMAVAFFMIFILWTKSQYLAAFSMAPPSLLPVLAYGTPAGICLAVFHFFIARNKTLEDLLASLGAQPADPNDAYHIQFIHLVQEAEAATGIQGIRPMVLSTAGCNAFSLQDGRGRSAIGVTDGLLSKLSRQELSAVVAHEAAHLVHEDSKLVTTACFLFGFFGIVNQALGSTMGQSSGGYGPRASSRSGGFWGAVLVLWIISGLGYLITKLVFMAISREREYLADADGVAMCKDPLALAESLYKISRRFRGEVPDTYSSLFILNPDDSSLDEREGFFANLFSNHPPVSERIAKLLVWAKSDIQTLQTMDEKEEKFGEGAVPAERRMSPAPGTGFMAYQGDQWVGPYSPAQFLSMGLLSPATWVCPAGGQRVIKASEAKELAPLFLAQVRGTVTANACPRCKVSLVGARYEGSDVDQCSFCKGYLLKAGILERLITREETVFSPEEIKKAKVWRDSQKGNFEGQGLLPGNKLPLLPKCHGEGDPLRSDPGGNQPLFQRKMRGRLVRRRRA